MTELRETRSRNTLYTAFAHEVSQVNVPVLLCLEALWLLTANLLPRRTRSRPARCVLSNKVLTFRWIATSVNLQVLLASCVVRAAFTTRRFRRSRTLSSIKARSTVTQSGTAFCDSNIGSHGLYEL